MVSFTVNERHFNHYPHGVFDVSPRKDVKNEKGVPTARRLGTEK